MQTDIIIIGLGISAKLTALSLGLHEFKVTLIPNQSMKNNTSNLVTFFSSGSIKFLSNILNDDKSIRCYEDIKRLCCSQYDQLNKKNFKVNFDNNKEEFLGKIIPNKKINELLDGHLLSNTNINILNDEFIDDIRYKDTQIEVATKKSASISAKLVI